MSNASLCHSLDSDWVDIYQYLLTRVMGDKVPEDMKQDELDNYKMGLLIDLKGWLWRKRVQGREEKGGAERAKAKAEAEARKPKQLEISL